MKINIFNRLILNVNLSFSVGLKKHWEPKVIKLAKEGKKLEGAKIMIEEGGMTLSETVRWYNKKGFTKKY